jgi:hypothetical protein
VTLDLNGVDVGIAEDRDLTRLRSWSGPHVVVRQFCPVTYRGSSRRPGCRSSCGVNRRSSYRPSRISNYESAYVDAVFYSLPLPFVVFYPPPLLLVVSDFPSLLLLVFRYLSLLLALFRCFPLYSLLLFTLLHPQLSISDGASLSLSVYASECVGVYVSEFVSESVT